MRQEAAYPAVQSICREYNVSISRMCAIAGIARASYYKWLNREIPEAELLNEAIAEAVMSIHKEYPDKGHRRIRDDLHCNHHFDTRKRLHPLNTGDASPSIRALDQATLHFMDNCRVVFSFTKKEISTRQGQYLFLLIIIHLSSI